MKANRGQIEKALDAPPSDIRFFLLYGPDEAGSTALARRLERAMGPGAERVDLDVATLREDPARLADEAASFSMFGDKRWVRINGMGDESLPAVTALLEAEAAGNPVIAIAGALKATSKLVKLALDHKGCMAFISYQPDAREAEQIAMATARENGLRLPQELARRIVDLANGDRALMGIEIEKLVLYLDAAPEQPREATAEALDALSADNPDSDAAPLVNAVLGGDLRAMHKELNNLAEIGAAMASVIRPLLTRAMLIANIRADFDSSGRLEAAVESAGKAVFWKEKGLVTRQVRLWDATGIARLDKGFGGRHIAAMEKLDLSEAEWRARLSPEQYHVLREAGTERAFTGKYNSNKADGVYYCAGCGAELFDAEEKYDSGSGWPSFTAPVDIDAVEEIRDASHGMIRTEVRCATCEGHLGHVFPDGPGVNGLRYCMNSASLDFKSRDDAE